MKEVRTRTEGSMKRIIAKKTKMLKNQDYNNFVGELKHLLDNIINLKNQL